MNVTRRALLTTLSAASILPSAATSAQSVSPSTDEFGAIYKGDSEQFIQMLAGIDALTHALVLRAMQLKLSPRPDLARWFAIRRLYNAPLAVAANMGQSVKADEAMQIAKMAGEKAKATAAKMEQALADGGLAKGSVLEPIREVWIHGEAVATSRLSMMRIMARRTKAATVVA
jgi:hypothetical protein